MYTCNICEKRLKGRNGKSNLYCSLPCYRSAQRNGKYKRGRKYLPCKICFKPAYNIYEKDRNGNVRTEFFCSKKCYSIELANLRGKCKSCETPIPARRGIKSKFCSRKCSEIYKRPKPRYCTICNSYFSPVNFSRNQQGRIRIIRRNRQNECSKECGRIAKNLNPERRKKISEAHTGNRHHNWQGGKSKLYRGYRGPNWKDQRLKALGRDNYCCIDCGKKQENISFHVDHIVPYHNFLNYIEANELDNLATRCASCHKKAESKRTFVQMVLPFDGGKYIGHLGKPKGERVGTSKFTGAQIKLIVDQINKGIPISDISRKHKISINHLNSIANGKSWKHITHGKIAGYKKCTAKGTRIAKTKLNENKVRQIKKLLSQEVSCKDIAIQFGVAKTTIQAIKYRISWKYVS